MFSANKPLPVFLEASDAEINELHNQMWILETNLQCPENKETCEFK